MTSEELIELKVNLIPAAYKAIENAAALNGDTKTDTVNRALQMYDFFTAEMLTGAKIYMVRGSIVHEVNFT